MLRIINRCDKIRFSEFMQVYRESNTANGKDRYPALSAAEQLIEAEQDLYQYLCSVFYLQKDALYAIWEEKGRYVSALRLEPYMDGRLLCALETAPDFRGQGFAKLLLAALQRYLSNKSAGKIYSHISKDNSVSLAVHKHCGFRIIRDCAVHIDGSVFHDSYTLLYEYEKTES